MCLTSHAICINCISKLFLLELFCTYRCVKRDMPESVYMHPKISEYHAGRIAWYHHNLICELTSISSSLHLKQPVSWTKDYRCRYSWVNNLGITKLHHTFCWLTLKESFSCKYNTGDSIQKRPCQTMHAGLFVFRFVFFFRGEKFHRVWWSFVYWKIAQIIHLWIHMLSDMYVYFTIIVTNKFFQDIHGMVINLAVRMCTLCRYILLSSRWLKHSVRTLVTFLISSW